MFVSKAQGGFFDLVFPFTMYRCPVFLGRYPERTPPHAKPFPGQSLSIYVNKNLTAFQLLFFYLLGPCRFKERKTAEVIYRQGNIGQSKATCKVVNFYFLTQIWDFNS